MLNKIKIGPKLTGGFLMVSIITIVVGIIGINEMNKIAKNDLFLFEKATMPLADLVEISMVFEMAMRDVRDLAREKDLQKKEVMIKTIDSFRSRVGKAFANFEAAAVTEAGKKLVEDFVEARKGLGANLDQLYILARSNKEAESYALIENGLAKSAGIEEDLINKMIKAKIDVAKDIGDKNEKSASNATKVLTVIMIIGVCLAITIGLFLTYSITKPLNQGVQTMVEMAKGNLMVNFDSHALTVSDETGILTRAMKEMVDKLKSIISFALEASENVSTGSIQLSSSSQGISQGSSEQASSVEEISASIEEMTASINQNADNANQTEKIALKSSADAKEGGEAVQKTVSAMKQIAEKISIIQEIARQTNLLSLNASIEAARAGEHGKGFAVVASAVQKLAERSQDAAEEISKLSQSSVDVAERAGDMLSKLVPDIQKTAELVSEINAASAEQNKGIQQVNTAVQQFNQVVQSNASASEELASTSEELSSQAEELKNQLSFFKVDNDRHNRKHNKNSRSHIPVNHVPSMLNTSVPITHLEKQTSAGKDDDSLNQKVGVSIDMGDDEDNNFIRI